MHSDRPRRGDDEAGYADRLTRSCARWCAASGRPASTSSLTAGKSSWNYYVYKRLGGFELRSDAAVRMADVGQEGDHRPTSPVVATDWARFPEFYADYFAQEQGEYEEPGGTWVCTGPVTYTGQEAIGRDIANLRAAMQAEGVQHGFLPVVAPASCFPTLIDEHYGSESAALMGIAEALREEYRAIVDAGLQVQIDDAFIPFMYDVLVPPGTMEDYLAWAQPRIDAVNHALEGIPAEMVRYHVEPATRRRDGPHTNDIPLRDVLPLVMQVNAGTYLFEAANPRHEHEWRVWEDVELRDDTVIAPGVISHATNVVEHPELVAERLERIARLVGPERCRRARSLARTPYLRRVHPTIQWAKLEALSEGAALASQGNRENGPAPRGR